MVHAISYVVVPRPTVLTSNNSPTYLTYLPNHLPRLNGISREREREWDQLSLSISRDQQQKDSRPFFGIGINTEGQSSFLWYTVHMIYCNHMSTFAKDRTTVLPVESLRLVGPNVAGAGQLIAACRHSCGWQSMIWCHDVNPMAK